MRFDSRTKTGRKQLARQARQWGFHVNYTQRTISVRCPLFPCNQWVTAPDPRPRSKRIAEALDRAVIEHLESYCKAVNPPTPNREE